jgi:hypothetical protein
MKKRIELLREELQNKEFQLENWEELKKRKQDNFIAAVSIFFQLENNPADRVIQIQKEIIALKGQIAELEMKENIDALSGLYFTKAEKVQRYEELKHQHEVPENPFARL